MRCTVIFVVLFLLVGCAARPSDEEVNSAYYGPMPSNSKEIAEEWIKQRLVDPMSAVFEHDPYVIRGYYSSAFGGSASYGWVRCGYVNARNRMGGYAGRERYYLLIRNDSVIEGFIGDLASRGCAATQ